MSQAKSFRDVAAAKRGAVSLEDGDQPDFRTLPALAGLSFTQALDVCRDGEYHEFTHPNLQGHFQHHPTGRIVYVVEGIAAPAPLFISDFDRDDWYVGRRLVVYGDDDQYHVAGRGYMSVLLELLDGVGRPGEFDGIRLGLADYTATKDDVFAALVAIGVGDQEVV